MYQDHQPTFSIRDFLTVCFKHKFKILVTFCVVVGATLTIAANLPKQFTAKSVVMVRLGREFMQVSEVGNERPPSPGEGAVINTEMQILTGHDLIERVVNAIGVQELYPQLEKMPAPAALRREIAIQTFSRNLSLNRENGTPLIAVSFRHEKASIATKAVNTLVEFFKEKHLQVFSDPKSSFLEAQLKEYEEKLKKSENTMGNFAQRNRVFSPEEEKAMLLKERTVTESTLESEQIKVKELQQKIDFLKQRNDAYTDSVVNQLRSNLNALEEKEQDLAEKYTDNSQVLISHRKEMQVVRDQLQKYEEKARNAETTKIMAELGPLQVRVSGLRKRYEELGGELQRLNSRSREFEDLKRERTSNEMNYETYLKKSEEARISDDLDRRKMTNVKVIEEAVVAPAKSNKPKVLGVGLLLSIVLSLGLAYAAEHMPHCFTTPWSAERKLGLPVLVSIGYK